MNAFVLCEDTEEGGTNILRVFFGEGDPLQLRKEFDKLVRRQVGPQPLPCTVHLAPAVVGGIEFHPISHNYEEHELNKWRARLHHASRPREFVKWLVESHGWKEAVDFDWESE